MKICVLRRDGQNVHNGMAMVIAGITEDFFGEKEIQLDKDELSQMLTFEIQDNEEQKIILFIKRVSEANPLYTVRIKA